MNRREFGLGVAGLLAAGRSLSASTDLPRITTGLPSVDEATGGFLPGEVVQIAGCFSSGRSGLALQIAARASEFLPVAYFAPFVPWIGNFRMDTKRACLGRILLQMSGVRLSRYECGDTTQEEHERARRAEATIARRRLVIYGSAEESNWDLESVGENARKISREGGLRLLVIDELMRLHPHQLWTQKRKEAELSAMGTFFVNLAEELQITVLVCSGLDIWTNQHRDWRPQESFLAGYGLPSEYCSTVALTHLPGCARSESEDFFRKAEITLVKTKTGRTGTLQMGWDRKFARFSERFPVPDERS